MNKIAELTGVSREALDTKLAKTNGDTIRKLRVPKALPQLPDKQAVEYAKAQDRILALMLLRPSMRESLQTLSEDMFAKAESKQLFAFLLANPTFDGSKSALQTLAATIQTQQADGVQNLGDYVKMLALEYEELYQDLDDTELAYEASRLTARLVETYVKNQKQYLAAQLANANEDQTQALLEQVKALDSLLTRINERT